MECARRMQAGLGSPRCARSQNPRLKCLQCNAAPCSAEVLLEGKASKASDVYSFGGWHACMQSGVCAALRSVALMPTFTP